MLYAASMPLEKTRLNIYTASNGSATITWPCEHFNLPENPKRPLNLS
jgi:hypothetical protein